jgi:hypothetical protein
MSSMKGQKVGPRGGGDRQPPAGDKDVRRWRREQLLDMGFSLADARALAEAPVELGVVRELLARGCPHGTAPRILL